MKRGFTLIELLAVIIILAVTITIVVVKVDKNLKDANKFGDERTAQMLEEAAILFVENYKNELSNINSIGVDTITINQLINKGLIESKNIKDNTANIILIANIDEIIKSKYTKTQQSVIFLNGSSQISIYKGSEYVELGAYVAVPGRGVLELPGSNISTNFDKNKIGEYEVNYTYSSATPVKRIVNVI